MRVILIIAFVLAALSGYTQTNMVTGNKAIGIHYGLSKYSIGTYGGADFQWMFKEKLLFLGTASYEFGRVGSTEFHLPTLSAGIMYNFYNYKNKFGFSVLGQGMAGIENGRSTYTSVRPYNKFVYGGKLGLEASLVTSAKTSIKMNFTEWYAQGSNVGNWFYTFSVGIMFNLN